MMRKHSVTVWSEVQKDHQEIIDNSPFNDIKYTYKSKFDNTLNSNPGELMATAHAGSFSMKLSANLDEAGYLSKKLETKCDIIVINGVITTSELTVTAQIKNITEEAFQDIANYTLHTCPVSNALHLKITLKATLKRHSLLTNRLMDNEVAY